LGFLTKLSWIGDAIILLREAALRASTRLYKKQEFWIILPVPNSM
jgi:hypothetical protein